MAGTPNTATTTFKNGKLRMRIAVQSVIIAMTALTSVAHGQSRIDAISTQFRWLGPNDKIVVERYDDPKVRNVSCYMS
jgi:CreA protein